MPLNDIVTEQTKATGKTQAVTNLLLDYLATHPDATIRLHLRHDITHPQRYLIPFGLKRPQQPRSSVFLRQQPSRTRLVEWIHP
jgi:hypothetical protein